MRLIGVLGGTFDPVHVGHVRLAIELQEQLGFDHTRLIPNGIPNHRDKAIGSDEHRLAMLGKVADGSTMQVDDREIRRGGISYMVDTLASLQADFPHDALCLILGLDAYLGLPQWHRWKTLFDLSHLVVATRPGSKVEGDAELQAAVKHRIAGGGDELITARSGKILFVDIPQLEISSTDIRRRCRQGLNISYLVPSAVDAFIRENHLYSESPDQG